MAVTLCPIGLLETTLAFGTSAVVLETGRALLLGRMQRDQQILQRGGGVASLAVEYMTPKPTSPQKNAI